ncbi:hypothetical protein ACCO45_011850 [Purpureocillium lilacinum]
MGRHDDEEGSDRTRTRSSSAMDPDQDELAGGSNMPSAVSRKGRGLFQSLKGTLNGGIRASDGSDADDTRSFGMESDYYGDATITSTPGGMPPPPRPSQSTHGTNQRRHPPLGSSPEPSPLPQYRGTKLMPNNPPVRSYGLPDDDDQFSEESGGEQDPSAKPIKLRHAGSRRQNFVLEIPGSRSGLPDPRQARTVDEDFEETKRQLSNATRATVPSGFFSNKPFLPPQGASGRQLPKQSGRRVQQKQQQYEDMKGSAQRRWQMPWNKPSNRLDFSDERNRSAINWWQLLNPWTHIKAGAWVLLTVFQRLVAAVQGLISGRRTRYRDSRSRSPLWRPLASLWQLLLSLWQLIVSMWQFVVDTLQPLFDAVYSLLPEGMQDRLSDYADWLPYVFGAIFVVVLGVALSSVRLQTWRSGSYDDMWEPVDGGSRWSLPQIPSISRPSLSLSSMSLPSISLPSMRRSRSSRQWEDIFKNGDLNDLTPQKVDKIFKKMGRTIDALGSADKLHDDAIKRLETIVPKVVHMELQDGRPVVSPDFYHALRGLMREDESIFTFDIKRNEFDATSERLWKAIVARLGSDPKVTSKIDRTAINSAKSSSAGSSSDSWNDWLKENQAKVQKIIGSDGKDKSKSAETGDRPSSSAGKVVEKDEYMKHLKNEVATMRTEMRAEVAELKPKMEKLVRETIDLAAQHHSSAMTRAEITTLVNGLVRRGLSEINLQALANGKIHAHWDASLKHQVNYFSIGAGAVADPQHSSPVYDPFSSQYFSLEDQKGASVHKPLEPIAALLPWKDMGDCFCGARAQSRHGDPHSASLGVLLGYCVIPQHIVVEHILPGATPDPGTRPRDIEVYAEFRDAAVHARVRDFSATHYPDPPAYKGLDWDYTPAELPDRFVKIAQFAYEGAEVHDGVHVQRLSTELLTIGAATDHVVVRAVSNYGARNQTCFYRVRLYGENIELAKRDAEKERKKNRGGLDGTGWLKRALGKRQAAEPVIGSRGL